MLIVSNTSPLTNLAAIGCFHLLHDIWGKIHISTGVVRELSARDRSWPGAQEVADSHWVQVKTPHNTLLVDTLRLDLDLGESETIVLALELQADLVLLDEIAGRHAAQHLGLKVMGIVGLLIRAKQKGMILRLRPRLDALRQQAGFYLSNKVYQQALQLANEQ